MTCQVREGDVLREGWPAGCACDGTCCACVTRQIDLAIDVSTPRRD